MYFWLDKGMTWLETYLIRRILRHIPATLITRDRSTNLSPLASNDLDALLLERRMRGDKTLEEKRQQTGPFLKRRTRFKGGFCAADGPAAHASHFARCSVRMNFSASGALVARMFGPSQSRVLPARTATTPARPISVSSPPVSKSL
jgi:hypothetical protein